MDYSKFLFWITVRDLQTNNLNVLWKRKAFYISNLSPIICLQMDVQKDLLELLKSLLEPKYAFVYLLNSTSKHHWHFSHWTLN